MIKKELLLASWLEKLQKKWDNEEYYYDVEEATKVFKFVSKLTNDRGASRQFELLEFQFEIITEILCVKRRSDGKRKHREAHINIPRKNGKSFLAAIIVVYLFFCQRHIFGALFILTANTTKQAGELYATVEHFIKTNKTLRRYCKITSSTKTIVRKDNGNKLMVLSSDADNADSFNDYVAVLDEIHQAKNDEMYGKLRTGQGAWDEPLIMTITTASSGEDPANPEMQLYTMAKKIEAGEVNDPILKNANIIIMDEASAAADPENEYELQQAFQKLMSGKTVIMIAHRLSSIQNVDQILFVQNGKVVEQGTHNELMACNGRYKDFQDVYCKANQWRLA